MQFPKLHFGPALFDLERSKFKGRIFFMDFAQHDLRHAKKILRGAASIFILHVGGHGGQSP